MQNSNLSMLHIKLLCQACWSYLFVFIFCEFGEEVKSKFSEINSTIGQSDWYEYPIEIRKLLSTVIFYTQKPVTLNGFGSISYTREAFKMVKQHLLNCDFFFKFGFLLGCQWCIYLLYDTSSIS